MSRVNDSNNPHDITLRLSEAEDTPKLSAKNWKLPSGLAYGISATIISSNVALTLVGGGLVATAHLINGIWNTVKLGFQKATLKLNKKKISNLSKNTNSVEALNELKTLITGQKADIEKTKADIKHNFHRFIGGILSAIPFCGLFVSDAYLGAVKGGKYRFGISKEMLELDPFIPTFLAKSVTEMTFYPGKWLDHPTDTIPSDYKREEIAVDRGKDESHTVTCHISFCHNKDPADPAGATMILFHANAVIGTDMITEAQEYKDAGWNVVLMTMGGYPGSDTKITTNEETSIQDVNAVLRYLDGQGVQNIGVHGCSIGGSLAMHATKLSDKISVVVLDKPFDTAANVAVNVVKGLGGSSLLPSALVRKVIRAGFQEGKTVYGVKDVKGNPYHTDGCDNYTKIQDFKGAFVCIKGTQDEMMGTKNKEGHFQSNFSDALTDAYKKKSSNRKPMQYSTESGHTPIGGRIKYIIENNSTLNLNRKGKSRIKKAEGGQKGGKVGGQA